MIPRLITNLIYIIYGIIFPVYYSLKALESDDVQSYEKWLTHWIIYFSYMILLLFTDIFLGFWLPFYEEIALYAFLYLISSNQQGRKFAYDNFLKPIFLFFEETIDLNLKAVNIYIASTIRKISSVVLKSVVSIVFKVIEEHNATVFEVINKRLGFKNGDKISEQLTPDLKEHLPVNAVFKLKDTKLDRRSDVLQKKPPMSVGSRNGEKIAEKSGELNPAFKENVDLFSFGDFKLNLPVNADFEFKDTKMGGKGDVLQKKRPILVASRNGKKIGEKSGELKPDLKENLDLLLSSGDYKLKNIIIVDNELQSFTSVSPQVDVSVSIPNNIVSSVSSDGKNLFTSESFQVVSTPKAKKRGGKSKLNKKVPK